MVKWAVEIESEAKKELVDLFSSGKLTQSDVEILRKWISEVEEGGIQAIEDSPYWNDHSLHSEWADHRSSSFSYRGRIIYKVMRNKILVVVVRITVDHDYRR